MRRAWWMACALAAACGGAGGGDVGSAQMGLQTGGGLMPGQVGAVEILVLDGAGASCARALQPVSPLDDPKLEVVAHALFTTGDGGPKHLAIPAGRKLVFYAEGYANPYNRARVGRGCAEASIEAGKSAGVTILISSESIN